MITLLKIILIIVVAPIIGCLLTGIDRKLTARLQNRVGPPILQPLYDFIKLLCKDNIVVNKYQNLYIVTFLVFVIATVVMFFFKMDLLMIVFVFTIANVALIVGAMSTGSPYSKVGCQRELMCMLAYEPILIMFIVTVYLLTGTFKISGLDQTRMPLIVYAPLVFISMLFIMSIKFQKSPFDFAESEHGHQELVRGIMTEFSGPSMALTELAHWYEKVFLLGLMTLFFRQNIVIGLLIALFTYLFVIILDNITARLTWQWMVKVTWTVIISISAINIILIYLMDLSII